MSLFPLTYTLDRVTVFGDVVTRTLNWLLDPVPLLVSLISNEELNIRGLSSYAL